MTTHDLEPIPTTILDHVTGGDQLGMELTNALRIGMAHNRRPSGPSPLDSRIHWDSAVGACTDGFGIVNCPRRRR